MAINLPAAAVCGLENQNEDQLQISASIEDFNVQEALGDLRNTPGFPVKTSLKKRFYQFWQLWLWKLFFCALDSKKTSG